MFSHYATRKISPICKIQFFFEDFSFLNPRSHLKLYKPKSKSKSTCESFSKKCKIARPRHNSLITALSLGF